MRRGVPAALAIVVLLGFLAACAGDDDDAGGASDAVFDGADEAARPGSATVASPVAALPAGEPVASTLPRVVVHTAAVTLGVDDVPAAVRAATRLAVEAGGLVASSQQGDEGEDATVTLKVPPAAFDQVLDGLDGLGERRSQQVGSDDITAQVVDLDARINALRASVDRLTDLIGRAANVGEVVAAEGELTRRTAELEALEGQLRQLRATADLSTITVRLQAPGQPAEAVSDRVPTFLDGLDRGWGALVGTGAVVLVVFGAVTPWLIPLGLVVAGWTVVRRRRLRQLTV
ncbi:MAG: DUF4349 domain-containing protein [Acidimicrobiia bacterium]